MRPVAIILLAAILTPPAQAELLGAHEVLQRVEKGATASTAQPPSTAAALLADIRSFRATASTLDPKRAAEAWIDLYERAERSSGSQWQGDLRSFDAEIGGGVGISSVLASLPGPAAWPHLMEAARVRAQEANKEPRRLALQLLAELLAGERTASAATLARLERLADKLAPQEKERVLAKTAEVRATVARLYGTREEIAAAFVASLDARTGGRVDVAIPDLVGLVGKSRAESILRSALLRQMSFRVPEGAETRVLARRVALEQVDSLSVPQWGLVDGVDAVPLYEVLARRFPAAADATSSHKREADSYYFLHLVIAGGHAQAEEALARIAGQQSLYLPKRAVEALQRAGHNEALFGFLHALLKRRPELRAWDVYTREAAYTGHSTDVIALADELLARKDLPAYLRGDLRVHRINALLAGDRVEPAVAALRELLSAGPSRGEGTARADAAIRLAGLGRILQRPELTEAGLSFAADALALPVEDREQWQRGQLLRKALAELRKLGMLERAQALAITELERAASRSDENEAFGMSGGSSDMRSALIELAALYGQANRQRDVVALLNESAKWGARDLREMLAEKDSLEVPIGLIAAKALAATGERSAALALARALIDELPGYDAAYELVAQFDEDAARYFDRVYARDQFQERPLIWKAIVLVRQGRFVEAESLIRSAIVIDPSDGEEGPNDRMRAYAVLADVLEKRGRAAQAATFRNAVMAIRISERSDELHKLGLYERAFAGYREALGHFADAYCIQSRLAVRLHEQGRRAEAFEHYRRAYELMPASFGRVESHCFGCESVFAGPDQQRIAEQVFSELLKRDAGQPQAHYLLGYLYKERGRNAESLKYFQAAVKLDPEYLNAWKHLHELGSLVYIEAPERDTARLKLLQLDPQQRHVHYELDSVGDLSLLWRSLQASSAKLMPPRDAGIYRLRRSGEAMDQAMAKLPEPMREQLLAYQAMLAAYSGRSRAVVEPRRVMARHAVIKAVAQLLGAAEERYLK